MPKIRVGVFATLRSAPVERRHIKRGRSCVWLLGVIGCAARPPSADAAGPKARVAAQPSNAPAKADGWRAAPVRAALPRQSRALLQPAPVQPAPVQPAPVQPAPVQPAPAVERGLAVERVLTVSVSSIALGEGSKIAVLGDEPYVGDAHHLRALPLPNLLRAKPGERDELRIFFGRDNEPRIMGTRRSSSGEASIYWRHTAGVWRDGREEIGQLGGTTRGGLWGVLGSADPELVCRAGAQCIIKRTSGWTTAPAGSAPRLVELRDGVLWGLDQAGLAHIDGKGWSVVMPAPEWTAPRAFWASAGEAWVAAERGLYHYREQVWAEEPLPIAQPAAFWGARADSIWIVGNGGAAHFDGRSWRRLSLTGPFASVVGRGEHELWFGGEAGLVYVQP